MSIAPCAMARPAVTTRCSARRPALAALASRPSAFLGGLRATTTFAPTPAAAAGRRAPVAPRAAAEGAAGGGGGEVDTGALVSYVGATSLQFGALTATLCGLDYLNHAVLEGISPLAPKAVVGLFYLFLAFRSRVFSPLDNSRPTAASEKTAIQERKRPSWMPPPLTFPIVWSTIGVLRSVSSVMVWEASGRSLLVAPLCMMLLHLSIGDTWNTINNIEKRMGTASIAVLFVLASACATDYLYFGAAKAAGLTLLPLCIWLSVATCLVWSIWDLNGRDSFLPRKDN